MTQTELALKVNMKQAAIARFENRTNNPKLETIILISSALDAVFDIVDITNDEQDSKRA